MKTPRAPHKVTRSGALKGVAGGHRPSGCLSTGGHFVWVDVQFHATGQDHDGGWQRAGARG